MSDENTSTNHAESQEYTNQLKTNEISAFVHALEVRLDTYQLEQDKHMAQIQRLEKVTVNLIKSMETTTADLVMLRKQLGAPKQGQR